MLPTTKGKYLLQDDHDIPGPNRLRPPGGGYEPKDKDLLTTICREMEEETGLDAKETRKHIELLGYDDRKPFWGSAIFELRGHKLPPGTYQASNDPDEVVTLVEKKLDDPHYVGPKLDKLMTKAEMDRRLKADPTLKEASAVASGRFITYDQLKERTRQECIKETSNPNPSPEEVKAWADQYMRKRYEEQKGKTSSTVRAGENGSNHSLFKTGSEQDRFWRRCLETHTTPGTEAGGQSGSEITAGFILSYDKVARENLDAKAVGAIASRTVANDSAVAGSSGEGIKEVRTSNVQDVDQFGLSTEKAAGSSGGNAAGDRQVNQESDQGVKNYEGIKESGTVAQLEVQQVPVRKAGKGSPNEATSAGSESGGAIGQSRATGPIPTRGPEAIGFALRNLDLAKVEADAQAIIKRKLKSKRPDAVKRLGFIEGFKRSGISPADLMIYRVPVIPPQFRPYTVAGDTFVPGDANELYRDLFNVRSVYHDLTTRLGEEGTKRARLSLYDAVSALYGYGEPTSPKTRERGISGFLKAITGSSPKFGVVQRQLLSKNMDYVGRGVIGVDPELHLDEIAIPDEMAWKLYAPYIQRRLVRAGEHPSRAVQMVRDRHDQASAMLDAEMGERPVIYSRSPAWHKFNIIAGWPKRVKGDSILINPLVTTGSNSDFDGDNMNIHLPSLDSSVDDAKTKLMPSKMLFSIKDPTKVLPVTKHESLLGNWSAQSAPAQSTHQFPDEASALTAIRSGRIRMSDEIQIGKVKP